MEISSRYRKIGLGFLIAVAAHILYFFTMFFLMLITDRNLPGFIGFPVTFLFGVVQLIYIIPIHKAIETKNKNYLPGLWLGAALFFILNVVFIVLIVRSGA
ncbi:hypothetical protein [Magnetococcus sp. PR-3]|uniref:hypothetical protein n=1 Tax=Magnetococcus sp. PR-3 TaxID=3120355 RepID=UPI002FCDF2FC